MHNVVTATGWISTAKGMSVDVKDLIYLFLIPILCGLFVLVVGWRTKAPGPTIGAVVLASVVLGLSLHMTQLADKTTQDINQYNNAPSTVQQGDR